MANVLGLQGLKTTNGRERLIAVFNNDYHRYNTNLNRWDGQGIPVSRTTKVRSDVFLDKAYFTNGYRIISADNYELGDDMKRYDGTNWRNETVVNRTPLALYIKHVGDRLYLANLYFKTINQVFASRVWYCDLPKNNEITWGFEEGLNLTGAKGQRQVTIPFAEGYFKARNIKIGDPLTLISSSLAKNEYFISEIKSDFNLVLTTDLEDTLTNEDFFVGGNWFDVATNDNNVITGLGENNDRLLVFKQDSLFRFNPPPSASLVKIKGVPGTTSQESVVNINEHTYYFHRTGIWRTNGVTAELLSRPIQDYIDAISPDSYSTCVAWRTGPNLEIYRVYVGNMTDIDNNISVTRGFIDFDTITEKVSIGNLPYGVTASTELVEGNNRVVYLGTDDDSVYLDNLGQTDGDIAIPFMIDTGFHFPAGPTVQVEFTRVHIHTRDGRGMQIRYKLYGTPWTKDKEWRGSLDDVSDEVTDILMKGRPEISNVGRGIAFQITSSATNRFPVIERIDIFWRPTTQRSL